MFGECSVNYSLTYFSFIPFLSVSLFLHALVNNCISFCIFLLICNKSSCIIIICFIMKNTTLSDAIYNVITMIVDKIHSIMHQIAAFKVLSRDGMFALSFSPHRGLDVKKHVVNLT